MKGVKLKCINNKEYESYLTLNKIYTCLNNGTIRGYNEREILISITDDFDYPHYVPKRFFIDIAQDRDNKLKKILNERNLYR